MLIECVMRNARAHKLQWSDPTVHSSIVAMADDLYVIEVLVAELDVVGGDVVELPIAEVDVVGWGWVDVVVDEEMELVVGVMAFVYDPYRMICFLTLLWICKICIFISSTLSIRPLKYTVNTYVYYTYTYTQN